MPHKHGKSVHMASPSERSSPTAHYQEIEYSVDAKVATICLNVPDKHNRLSFLMRNEIIQALRLAEQDEAVSIILIRANGPSFSAGYDLTRPRDERNRPAGWVSATEFDGWTDPWARSCVRDWMVIWNLLKPVVAMVHGYCLAGGTELMSMCDITFVADDAIIGYPPMRGMTTPDVPYFPWKMTMAHAKYLQLTGNSVSGSDAAQMGWVAKSFPSSQLQDQTMREIRAISSIPVSLLSANKQQVNQAFDIMGMRTHFDQAWAWHQLSGSDRPNADEFARRMQRDGLREALRWRDGPFIAEGL
jgi:enoyl-CoA hydratase